MRLIVSEFVVVGVFVHVYIFTCSIAVWYVDCLFEIGMMEVQSSTYVFHYRSGAMNRSKGSCSQIEKEWSSK